MDRGIHWDRFKGLHVERSVEMSCQCATLNLESTRYSLRSRYPSETHVIVSEGIDAPKEDAEFVTRFQRLRTLENYGIGRSMNTVLIRRLVRVRLLLDVVCLSLLTSRCSLLCLVM